MLPDFPKVKKEVSNLLLKIFKSFARQEVGFFSGVAQTMQHEGRKGSYSTMEGTIVNNDYQKMEVFYQIKFSEVPTMTFEDVLKILEEKGKEMGDQMGKYFFKTVNQTINKTGNSVDAKGKPFSLDLMYKTLEKMEIPFDEDGNPRLPTMVVNPQVMEKIKEIKEKEKIENKYEQKHKQLIELKRKEWNEKQNNRKLAD